MKTNFKIDITPLGLKMNYLYEILATTFSFDNNQMVPNTASMGVRLVDKNTLKIWPYPTTTTYKNIEKNKFVVLNFVDDVFLYALASLKDSNHSRGERILSRDFYSHLLHNYSKEQTDNETANSVQIPYLKESWAIMLCQARDINQILKKDDFGKSKLMEINLTAIFCKKFKESFKLFNRAENLTLETIILSTRLNLAAVKKDERLVGAIKSKIEENLSNIKRFGKNISALKAIEHIENYIQRFEI